MNLLSYDEILRVAILGIIVFVPMFSGFYAGHFVYSKHVKELQDSIRILRK